MDSFYLISIVIKLFLRVRLARHGRSCSRIEAWRVRDALLVAHVLKYLEKLSPCAKRGHTHAFECTIIHHDHVAPVAPFEVCCVLMQAKTA